MANNIKVNDSETMKAKIEEARELTISEKIRAYLANHAVEHYCAAVGAEPDEVEKILEYCKKEEGVYWRFTCPVIGGTNADGKPNPTKEQWEACNKGAVRCDVMDSKQWYKKATTLADASTVRAIVASYGNYADAKEKGKARLVAVLRDELATAAVMGNMEKVAQLVAQIKEIG